MASKDDRFAHLPDSAVKYIKSVVRRVGMGRKVKRSVRDELVDHFSYALTDCDEADRPARAAKLVAEFGSVKLLAKLIRRGKKRCRPLWKKAIIRGFQAVGLLILFCILYTFWLTTGEPTIRVDYVAKLNKLARPQVPQDQNAWPHYKRAIELYVEPDDEIKDIASFSRSQPESWLAFSQQKPTQQELLKKWLDDNEPAWREFELGSAKPHYWVDYSTKHPNAPLIAIILPSLSRPRQLAKAGMWHSRRLAAGGQVAEAVDCCLTTARAGRHFSERNGFLIEQVVGIRISSLAHSELLRLAATDALPESVMANAQRRLESLYDGGFPMISLAGERFFFLDSVQRCFTEGGLGGGHLLVGEFRGLLGSDSGDEMEMAITLGGMLLAGRDETVALGTEYYDLAEEVVRLSPRQRRAQGVDDRRNEFFERLGSPRNLKGARHVLLTALLPSLSRAGEIAYRAKANHEATIAVLALRRWRVDNGECPESLQTLVDAGNLKALPEDPYSDEPLKYAKRGDDFVLYSVGADFTDDGGVRQWQNDWGQRSSGIPRQHKGGDRVFWPVELEAPEEVRKAATQPSPEEELRRFSPKMMMPPPQTAPAR